MMKVLSLVLILGFGSFSAKADDQPLPSYALQNMNIGNGEPEGTEAQRVANEISAAGCPLCAAAAAARDASTAATPENLQRARDGRATK